MKTNEGQTQILNLEQIAKELKIPFDDFKKKLFEKNQKSMELADGNNLNMDPNKNYYWNGSDIISDCGYEFIGSTTNDNQFFFNP